MESKQWIHIFNTIASILFFVLTFASTSNGQNVNGRSNLITKLFENEVKSYSIKEISFFPIIHELDSYLVNREYIDKDDDYQFLQFNLLSKRSFDFNSPSIFIFGIHDSHPTFFICIEDNNGNFEILENINFELTLDMLNAFFKLNNISQKNQLIYVFEIVKFYNQENGFPIPETCINYSWDCWNPSPLNSLPSVE